MRVQVVCATPRGGHIEHAADLTAALRQRGADARLLSRRGAAEYLPDECAAWVDEIFPSAEALPTGRFGSLLRLVVENVRLSWWRASKSADLLVLEEPRFPLAFLPPQSSRRVFIAHNAQLHERRTLWSRIQGRVQTFTLRRADLCVVHGDAQARRVELGGARVVRSARLPGQGLVTGVAHSSRPPELPPDVRSFLLCLGELRPNKGLDIAIEAARLSERTLVIAGAPVDPQYASILRSQSPSAVHLIDRFLTPQEFAWLLEEAAALSLPYRSFDAQSGVLARAMELGRPVIVSDLPSLLEQAGAYSRLDVHGADDPEGLAAAMARADEETEGGSGAHEAVDDAWDDLADACLSALE